jgi:translation initiation factor IF-1
VSKQDALEFVGVIIEALPNQTFKVQLENNHIVNCYTGGKMRKHKIRLVAGDKVTIEMTPYDLDKGRIMFRL